MTARRSGPGQFRVAVVGAGPSGAALAQLLARQGVQVTLFDDGRRPGLVVGESLVPAAIPLLERLGAEQDVAAVSLRKPGVSFAWSAMDRVSFRFARFAPAVPPYAYNVPRPQFEELLVDRAVAAGVERVVARAQLEPRGERESGHELRLAPDTLEAARGLQGRQPDLIVDATGRGRQAARALGIPALMGPRRDVAHFAHFEGYHWDDEPGQVVIGRGQAGWNWCIPLRDRLSVGIVLPRPAAEALGPRPEERLDCAIASDPRLTAVVGGARRVTPVATYANYQLVSARGHGPGWVMVGDAFGFVDPMLSPGVYLALRSAELLAEALAPAVTPGTSPTVLTASLGAYASRQRAMLMAWMDLVSYLYDGRLMAMLRSGRGWTGDRPGWIKQMMQDHIERQVALQASGIGTTRRYGRALLRLLGAHGLRGIDPADFAIR